MFRWCLGTNAGGNTDKGAEHTYHSTLDNENRHGLDYPQTIICSRQEEYNNISENAPVKASVLINSLTSKKVKFALEQMNNNTSAQRLLYNLKQNEEIAQKLTTAFEVHLALNMTRNPQFDFKKLSREYLINSYIQQELEKLLTFLSKYYW